MGVSILASAVILELVILKVLIYERIWLVLGKIPNDSLLLWLKGCVLPKFNLMNRKPNDPGDGNRMAFGGD